jgi:hypothetical protein
MLRSIGQGLVSVGTASTVWTALNSVQCVDSERIIAYKANTCRCPGRGEAECCKNIMDRR